jgi:diguanylate cyclase (GGDEF)-like protein/PAS domain S-box-containing protein
MRYGPLMLDFPNLFIAPPDNSLLYTGHYDPVLVLSSIATAIFAAYTALLASQHVGTTTHKRTRLLWLLIGGLCLGLGIWAMHFVSMLAFSLPCITSYDTISTLLSMVPGVLAGMLALNLISRPALSASHMLLGATLLGLGIATMHYIGMTALRLEGLVRYDLGLVLLSLVLSVLLSLLTLCVKFQLQSLPGRWRGWAPLLSGLVLGGAISGIHYTAMAAAYFIRDGSIQPANSSLGSAFLATLVLTATSATILVTLVATYIARPNLLSLGQSSRIIALLIGGWCLISWFSAAHYEESQIKAMYQQEMRQAQEQAKYVASNINENLQLLQAIPLMFSRDADIHRILNRFGAQAQPSALNYEVRKRQWSRTRELTQISRVLQLAATHLKADVIWLLNAAGDTVAASNFDQPDSFVGINYRERDYFRQARAGRRGQQYAVGWVTKLAGLFYSYPVFEKGEFLGAVVVKRNIVNFDQWTRQAEAMITDSHGVIVLAPNPKLQLQALPKAPLHRLSDSQKLSRYGQLGFQTLGITPWNTHYPDAVYIGTNPLPVVLASRPVADGLLTLHVPRPLLDLERIRSEHYGLFLLMATAGSMLIVAVSAIVLYLRTSRKTEADLRIAATAFDTHEAMLITDANGVILRVNRAFTESTGYTAQEAIGQTPAILKSGKHNAHFYAAMWDELHRTGSWQGEIWDRRKNGDIYPKWLTISAVKGADGTVTHYLGMHADITERKAAEEEIRHLAFFDPLTHLPNRRLLLNRLQQALAACARSGRQGALLFIDLDNFKTLNDTRGHDVGDLLLQQVAQRLLKCVREEDTVARLGGDEFVVMLENLGDTAQEAATHGKLVGEKIIEVLNQGFDLAGHEHHTTPSIGIALFTGHTDTVDELLKRADLAMYQSKASGRNTLRFFDSEMQATVTARAELEAHFRDGLHHGQFQLYYQKQVDHQGRLVGAEALVRWRHPRRGLVSPAEFIPMAEETGLILPLGQWVLETACRQLAQWARQAHTEHLSLAVNISARQFRHPDFSSHILRALSDSGANPERLKLEITESLLLDDIEDIIAKMMVLKAHGVGFALDDFGTGYSSLSYLRRLPLDQLKIDQSFVRDIFTDANDAAIVRAIVALAESLGLNVIAEGVETLAQRDFLARQGCLTYQGYLFGQPMPVESLDASEEDNVSMTGA